MPEPGGETTRQISDHAHRKFKASEKGVSYIDKEQGGTHQAEGDLVETLRVQNRITSLTGISELTGDLRTILFDQAANNELTDSSAIETTKHPIQHQENFVRELLGKSPRIILQLAEIEAKLRLVEEIYTEHGNGQTNDDRQFFLDRATAWKNTIHAVSASLCRDEDSIDLYNQRVQDDYRALNEQKDITSQNTDGSTTTRTKASYKKRLKRILANPRARKFIASTTDPKHGENLAAQLTDEYLETAFTINSVRVLNRIQGPLSAKAKHLKLLACLEGRESDPQYAELIASEKLAESFNAYRRQLDQVYGANIGYTEEKKRKKEAEDNFRELCKPHIETYFEGEVDSDETIDLIVSQQRIRDIFRQATDIRSSGIDEAEKKTQLAKLDNEFQGIIIPIANKVNRVFPHEESTNLTDVLENEDAICAGKVSVLLATSKFLGLNARANKVSEMMDNGTSGHVCYECDLPSGNKLVIDSNFSNTTGLEGKNDTELEDVIRQRNPGINDKKVASIMKYYKRAIVNASLIPPESRVLIYRVEYAGQTAQTHDDVQKVRNTKYHSVRINPYTGEKEVGVAHVPYPHKITLPDKDGYLFINSSFCNNTAKFIRPEHHDIGRYLFERQIEMSPYDTSAHRGYVFLLGQNEAIQYLEQLKSENPIVYNDGANCTLAEYYVRAGRIDEAITVYDDMKDFDIRLYNQNIHRLSDAIASSVKKEDPNYEKCLSQAIEILHSARDTDPHAFYQSADNLTTYFKLHEENEPQKTAFLEDFERVAPSHFWTSMDNSSVSSPVQRLISLYQSAARKTPEMQTRLVDLYGRAKTMDPEFYVKYVFSFHKTIGKEHPDVPNIKYSTLEEARNINPAWFHEEGSNTTDLARYLQEMGKIDEAVGVFIEASEIVPRVFWNGYLFPSYARLVSLYETSGQLDKAIEVCLEAKNQSVSFWEQSYSHSLGYSQMAKLLAKNGRLTAAIDLCTEAMENDHNFYDPSVDDGNSGYIQLSILYAQSGQTQKAIQLLSDGRHQDSHFWISQGYRQPASVKLADLYKQVGQLDSAISVLEELREQKPDEYWQTDYYKVASMYKLTGDADRSSQVREEMIQLYEKLRREDPEAYGAYDRYGYKRLAQLYDDGDETDKVVEIVQEAISKFDIVLPRLVLRLAEIYITDGNVDMATKAYVGLIQTLKGFSHNDRAEDVIQAAKKHGIQLTGD